MKRIIIVYNPRSSKQAKIRQEVIEKVQAHNGYQIGKFEVKHLPVEENAQNLARILMDGDLVIVAGGDGTASVGINAAMITKAEISLGILGYGNFNDAAKMFKMKNCDQIISEFEKGQTKKLYPLEAYIDGRFFRYAACYFSIGMFAESTEEFNNTNTRKSLKKGKKGLLFSIRKLAFWYFKHKKFEFLPEKVFINQQVENGLSDILFVNSKTVAKIMKGANTWQQADTFLFIKARLASFFRLVFFMMKSIFHQLPGEKRNTAIEVEFPEQKLVEIQAEGEYQKIKLKKLEVKKSTKSINIVARL